MATICLQCGFENPQGMRFCGNCGVRLPEAPPMAEITPAPGGMGAMMGADLLERFRRAGLEASGQRRNVTVLFADLSGYTDLAAHMDSEDLYELMQKFIGLLANDVYKYEGMVDKFTGDGLMALFGAPIAHESNAELAVRAAMDMQADVTRLSQEMKGQTGTELHVHIGLHAGSVIVGGIGSDMLMNYTAIGDTVNLAHRLDEAAGPGVTLVSETVFQRTKALFEYQPNPNLELKGFLRPVTAYRVLGTRIKPGAVRGIEGLHAPMIGRDAELRRLNQLIGALVAYQQGQFVMVVGEAGMGKSRLVNELKALSAQLPVTILEGYSLTYRRSVSYWIFLDLLRNYLGVTPDTPLEQVGSKLRQSVAQVLGEQAPEVLPYLEYLLSVPPSDPSAAGRLGFLGAVQLRQQIFLAVRDFLVAEARRRPLALILEDLHWADDASLGLLNFLLETVRQAPLLVLAVTRPFEEEGEMGKIAERAEKTLADGFSLITLQGLSPHQSQQLLHQLLAVPDFPESLREQIVERAAGIPFYLEEILRMMIDEGILQREDHQWRVIKKEGITSLGVPDTLQGLILARFDRLNRSQRRLLQVASVIGAGFSLPVLQITLQPMGEEMIRSALAQLVEREFVVPEAGSSETEFRFRHVLTADAIYKTMLKRDRSELHGQIGEALERVYARKLDGQVEILARHYSWSPRHDRALHYLILAGQKATRSYLNDQAHQYFSDALVLLTKVKHTTSQALQVHLGMGDILVLAGEYQAAQDRYLVCKKLLAGEAPNLYLEERVTLERKISTTFESLGNYEQALICLADAQGFLAESPATMAVENAQILNDIGWIHFQRGHFEDAEACLLEALKLTRDTPRHDVIASIYNRLGGVYYQKNQLDQASLFTRKSLEFREEIGDVMGLARSYNNLGLIGWKRGAWDQAMEDFLRSLELNASLGDVEGLVVLHNNIGLLHTDKGNLEEARFHLEKNLEGALKIGHSYLEGQAYMHLGRLWLAAKEWEKSLEYSQLALAIVQNIESGENLANLYTDMGEAWFGLGDLDQAQQCGQMAMQTLNERELDLESLSRKGRIFRLLGNINRNRGDLEKAAELLKESETLFTTSGNQLELGRTLVAKAFLFEVRQDSDESHKHLAMARRIFQKLGAALDLRELEQKA